MGDAVDFVRGHQSAVARQQRAGGLAQAVHGVLLVTLGSAQSADGVHREGEQLSGAG